MQNLINKWAFLCESEEEQIMKEESGVENNKQLNFDEPSYEDIVWLKKFGVDVPITYNEYASLKGEYKQLFNDLIRRELQGDTIDDPSRKVGDKFSEVKRPNLSDEEVDKRIKDFEKDYDMSLNYDEDGNRIQKTETPQDTNRELYTFLFVKLLTQDTKRPQDTKEQEVVKKFKLSPDEIKTMYKVDSFENVEHGSEIHLYRFSKEALKKLETTMTNLINKWHIKKEDFVNLGIDSIVNNGNEINHGIPQAIRDADPNALGYVYSDSIGKEGNEKHVIAPRGRGAKDKDPNDRDYYYGDQDFSTPDMVRFIEFFMYNSDHEIKGTDRSDELIKAVFPNGEIPVNEEYKPDHTYVFYFKDYDNKTQKLTVRRSPDATRALEILRKDFVRANGGLQASEENMWIYTGLYGYEEDGKYIDLSDIKESLKENEGKEDKIDKLDDVKKLIEDYDSLEDALQKYDLDNESVTAALVGAAKNNDKGFKNRFIGDKNLKYDEIEFLIQQVADNDKPMSYDEFIDAAASSKEFLEMNRERA